MGAIFLIHDPKVEAAKAGDQAREWGSRKSGRRIVDSVKGGGKGREEEGEEGNHPCFYFSALPPSLPPFSEKGGGRGVDKKAHSGRERTADRRSERAGAKKRAEGNGGRKRREG